MTDPKEVTETEYPEIACSVDAPDDMSFQFADVVLNDACVLMAVAVATVAWLLVSTVGPETPIFAMADDRVLKSVARLLERVDRDAAAPGSELIRTDSSVWILDTDA